MIRKTGVLFIIQFFALVQVSFSQKINCDWIYWVQGSKIYGFDPVAETYEYIGLNTPEGSGGLGIGKDIIGKTDKLTFFTTDYNYLYYYDGAQWIKTDFLAGSVNLGGGGDHWYILDGAHAKVYKFDGTGDAQMILDLSTFNGPFDLVGDTKGN